MRLRLQDIPTRTFTARVEVSIARPPGGEMFALGDWFATAERVRPGFYQDVSDETGYSVQTLTNAKCVCTKLPPEERPEGLYYAHASEIVGHCEQRDYAKWCAAVTDFGLTIKELRQMLT